MITKGERTELRSLIRQRFKVLRAEVEARRAELEVELAERVQQHFAEEDIRGRSRSRPTRGMYPMSHYSVIVCLPGETASIEDALNEVMAPFDEGLDVEPYRRYEDGSAEEYWWVRSVRRGAEHLKNGTGLELRDRESVSFGKPPLSVEEKRAEYEEDTRWSEAIGSPATWKAVVEQYNAKFYPQNAVAVPGDERDDSDSGLLYEEETDRAYEMSQYNPESKWDYWRIGGRWSGYFQTVPELPAYAEVIVSERHWDGPKELKRHSCDGGRKRLLDFESMRAAAQVEAHERYDRWEKLYADHGPAKSWSHYVGLVEAGEMSIDLARHEYHAQPLIAAHKKLPDREQLAGWGDDLVETFSTTREEYVRLAGLAKVAGYALLTLKGEWVAPGRMGWFGMSSDGPGEREGYQIAVNKYLDELSDDAFVVVLDCHI